MILLAPFLVSVAQPLMQASLGAGSQANRIKIFVRPAATQTPATISTLQFNLGVSTSIIPKPTLTVVSTTFAGVTWGITQATEGGFYNFQLITATSPLQRNTVANTEFEVMEVQFSGGPLGLNNVALVTLADGGLGASNGNSLFLCTGTLASAGTNLYYTKTGVTVNNQNSYDASGATSGVATSTATIGNVSLPLSWVAFSAQQQNNSAAITWKVANQSNNSHFDIEASTNGISFSTIGIITATENNSYIYSDALLTVRGSKAVYYRIKQTDKDGKFSYSGTAVINLQGKNLVTISPNPASSFVYVNGKVLQLQITDLSGRVHLIKNVSNANGNKIDISSLQKGMYIAILHTHDGTVVSEKLFIQ